MPKTGLFLLNKVTPCTVSLVFLFDVKLKPFWLSGNEIVCHVKGGVQLLFTFQI